MAASTTTPHIRKRQYQPSIDSFFRRHDSASSASSSFRPMSPISPLLDAETQSSLISVGMRVRKSVPEGYKTHKTIGLAGFPFPSTAPPASAPARPTYNSENSRELTPFCGLHKVGGWAAQPSIPPPSSAPPALSGRDKQFDDLPALKMSQNTLSTTQNSFTSSFAQSATRKRSRDIEDAYEQDIENDLDAFFDDFGAEEVTKPSGPRVIARPRGMENKVVEAGPVSVVDSDFDEASFLAPVDGMEVDDARF